MNDEKNGRITSNADDGQTMQATANGLNPQYNAETTQPTVAVSKHALRTAISQAERAVDNIMRLLNEASSQRDDAARSLGDLQRKVDVLTAERNFLTSHVRNLQSASGQS